MTKKELEMENKILREALKPFAKFAEFLPYINHGPLLQSWCVSTGEYQLTVEMINNAVEALGDG